MSLLEQEIFMDKFNKILSLKLDSELSHQSNLITKLRQSILQDAVHGKLVKQNPKDEPASLLLEKIKKAKQKLTAEGKLKKEKELPPIAQDEIPFELPNGWAWCRLQNITTLITDGKHGDSENQTNSGYYFLSAKDIKFGKLNYDFARQITFKDFDEVHRRTNLEAGDICIVNTGATIGKMAIAQDNEFTNKTTFQKSVAVVKPYKKLLNVAFISNLLLSSTKSLLKLSGGSAINNLLLGDMKMLLVALPPLSEQHRIESKVEELMRLCDELEQQVNQSKNHAQTLMQSVLTEAFEIGPQPELV
jgi:type I restriction enzyme S subunit